MHRSALLFMPATLWVVGFAYLMSCSPCVLGSDHKVSICLMSFVIIQSEVSPCTFLAHHNFYTWSHHGFLPVVRFILAEFENFIGVYAWREIFNATATLCNVQLMNFERINASLNMQSEVHPGKQISALFSHHQRNFLLQQMRTKETHSQTT